MPQTELLRQLRFYAQSPVFRSDDCRMEGTDRHTILLASNDA